MPVKIHKGGKRNQGTNARPQYPNATIRTFTSTNVHALRRFLVKTSRGKIRTMSFNRRLCAVAVDAGFGVGSLIADIVMKSLTPPVALR